MQSFAPGQKKSAKRIKVKFWDFLERSWGYPSTKYDRLLSKKVYYN